MKQKRTRDLLLKTSINLFAKSGYADTSIRDIGSKAGISTSALYHYFKNKQEILFEIILISSQELIQELKKTRQQHDDPVECLREMLLTHMVHFSLKKKKETQIIVNNMHFLKGKNRIACQKFQNEIYKIYRIQLKTIAENDLMNDLDQTVIAFSIFGIISSFYSWYLEQGRLSKEEIAQNILDIIFNGIIKQK
ncbi:MAG: TetR/AcrR family transcriptional regulator [Bacteroidales bacterium]|nr:TetR/AcrR family transcriptional regulator [Bacteroidales bacterium]